MTLGMKIGKLKSQILDRFQSSSFLNAEGEVGKMGNGKCKKLK